MESNRRQFCGLGLIAPIFGLRGAKRNRRSKHRDTVLFHGAMSMPEEVLAAAYKSPVLRTTHRKLAVKVVHEGVVYLLRVVGGRDYVGEIVRTQAGFVRVHCWALATGAHRSVEEIMSSLDLSQNGKDWKSTGIQSQSVATIGMQ